MSLIKLDFRGFYFITLGKLFSFFWLFWLLIPLALMGFASPSLDIKNSTDEYLDPLTRKISCCAISKGVHAIKHVKNA